MRQTHPIAVAALRGLCYMTGDLRGNGCHPLPLCEKPGSAAALLPGYLYDERVDVSEPVSMSTGIAARYATALFDLASEEGALTALEADVGALETALADSADLRDLITSPIYGRGVSAMAIGKVAEAMQLSAITGNTLRLMASKRRLFVLPALLTALRAKIADHKGEISAEVTSAKALTKAQSDKLSKVLKAATGRDVTLKSTVDESLIGGLVVKVGSTMIDTSIKAKLNALQNTMKEVG
ncbi:ATP synthase F1 subcomplex delta subunit [Roseicyclus mahoneyensis]|uniref:ATP synthase subunit delta n=2 Tax=Roseicyclus mahoneyensis TaxID=164332 RepID=A0A316GER2_9RHOB|nr:ATP synthase F1 subcomplex delta subunit [Roseicyclus mahoneyensis]